MNIMATLPLIKRLPKTFACGSFQVLNSFDLNQSSHRNGCSLQCSKLYLANDLAIALRSGVWSLSGRNAINAPRSLQ
jgi:hypothetical protein